MCRTAGHHVPADTAAGNLVESSQQPRQDVGRIGEGSQRRNDPDSACGRKHPAGHHRWILTRRGDRLGEIDIHAVLPCTGHIGGILDQQVVEARTLERTREVHDEVRLHPVTADVSGPLLAPRLSAGSLEEPAEMEHVCTHDDLQASLRRLRSDGCAVWPVEFTKLGGCCRSGDMKVTHGKILRRPVSAPLLAPNAIYLPRI